MPRHAYSKRADRERFFDKTFLIMVLIAIAAAFFLRAFVIQTIRVEGPSMQPTLYTGERVLVEKVSYLFSEPKRYDIVTCRYPGEDDLFVKRVIGLEGETVSVKDGDVYINGERLEDDPTEVRATADMDPVQVPAGYVFVMGDNRKDSKDSRDPSVGPIPKEDIVGHALCIIWPLDMIRGL